MKAILINYKVDKLKPLPEHRGYNDKRIIVKQYQGERKFTSQAETEKFLKRLQDLKIRLAFRCAGKYPESTRVAKNGTKTTYDPFPKMEYTKDANEAIRSNLYRLSVNIQTQRA